MAGNQEFSQKWLKIQTSRLQNIKIQTLLPQENHICWIFQVFFMLKYFFHTFGSQTVLESQTLSYGILSLLGNMCLWYILKVLVWVYPSWNTSVPPPQKKKKQEQQQQQQQFNHTYQKKKPFKVLA